MLTLLESVTSRTARMETEQSRLISSFTQLKESQENIKKSISDINTRFSAFETKTSAPDVAQQDMLALRELKDNLVRENAKLRLCQSLLEDRQRRDNLLYFGLRDRPSKTWEETKEKLLNMISTCFSPVLTKDAFVRAHRIGAFSEEKCRPVIVKFRSSKRSNKFFLSQPNLKVSP